MTEGPVHTAGDVLSEPVLVPQFIGMAETGVDDPPLSEVMVPAHGVVVILSISFGEIDTVVVDAHEHIGLGPVPVLEGVDLIGDFEALSEHARRRMLPVFDNNANLLMPGVAVEPAAEHGTILGPVVAGIGGVVHAKESLSLPNKLDDPGLLLVGELEVPRCGENQQIEFGQRFGGEFVEPMCGRHIPAVLGTQLFEGDLTVGQVAVLETRRVPQDENVWHGSGLSLAFLLD